MFVIFFWTGEYFIYLIYNNDLDTTKNKSTVIVSYEEVNYVSAINNLFEVSLSLIIIYCNNRLNTI